MSKKRIEFSFSIFQCIILCAGSLLVLVLTFVLGVMLGREMSGLSLFEREVKSEVVKMRIDPTSAVQPSPATSTTTGVTAGQSAEAVPKPDITFYDTLSKKESEAREPAVTKTSSEPVGREEPKIAAKPKELYTIQVGAMKDRALADKLVSKLKKAGYSVYILSSEPKGTGVLHRVRVGTFSSKEAALKEAEKIERNEDIKAAVVEK